MQFTLWTTITLSLVKILHGQMEPFIVGGTFANIKRYPHSAFMSIACLKKTGDLTDWICGASIVNQRILLTAAHCLAPCVGLSEIMVTVGSEHRGKGVNISAFSFVVHEEYNSQTSAADIGLVRLHIRLMFGATIRRVALMPNPPYHEQAYVSGWGVIDEDDLSVSPYLKQLDQNVWSDESCIKLLKTIPKRALCASAQKSNSFASMGDSGSALMVRGYIQIGIVSHKLPMRAGNVIVYTDVGQFYDWIQFHAKRLYCNV